MITRIKSWLRARLFATDELLLAARREALEAQYKSVDIVRLTREQLNGFNLPKIDATEIAIGDITDTMTEVQRKEYYAAAHDLYKNETFRKICDFLVSKQVLHIATSARDITEVNFNRATINGISLIWDELKTAEGIYLKNNEAEGSFDQFSIT